MPGKKVKCFHVVPEKVKAPCEEFAKRLKKIRRSMKASTKEESQAVLYYVPVVSRARSDIEAALQRLAAFGDQYVALVVLHHTFDRECVVPDSNSVLKRDKTIAVDCLFSEDEGLLLCRRNKEAVEKVADWLKFVKHLKKPSLGTIKGPSPRRQRWKIKK